MSLTEKNLTQKYTCENATIYVCDISELYDLPGVELLTSMRRERMFCYLQHADRARCLAAGLMLRYVFGSSQVENILRFPFGKPYLPFGPFFNLSHSGSKVILLVGSRELGVDIEKIVPYSHLISQRVFTACEQMWLNIQRSDEAFFRLWTGKESIMKALGMGLHLSPESFEISPLPLVPNRVCDNEWFLYWQLLDGHILCCASTLSDIKYELIVLNREKLLKQTV